jgi:hypothetical protein
MLARKLAVLLYSRGAKSADKVLALKFLLITGAPKTMFADLRLCIVITLGFLLPALGCASIIDGMHSNVTVESFPPAAHVVVKDRNGKEVASESTPAVIKLKRGSDIVLPAKYTATIEAPGYEPRKVDLKYKINPWAFGNIIFGGIPGLIVDDATGALWTPDQTNVAVALQPVTNASQIASVPAAVSPKSAVTSSGGVQKAAYNAVTGQAK